MHKFREQGEEGRGSELVADEEARVVLEAVKPLPTQL